MSEASEKELLRSHIDRLNDELRRIEDAEATAENRELIGRCFKTRNSYGSSGSGDWILYTQVTGVSGRYIKTFRFEVDCYGWFSIKPDEMLPAGRVLRDYDEISVRQFKAAWNRVVRNIEKIKLAEVPQ